MPSIPNAPCIGQRFASDSDIVESYWKTVVPRLGVAIGRNYVSEHRCRLVCNKRECTYVLVLLPAPDLEEWVVSDESCLKHNHGPAPQLLKNPDWRPRRFNARQQKKVRQCRTFAVASLADENLFSANADPHLKSRICISFTKARFIVEWRTFSSHPGPPDKSHVRPPARSYSRLPLSPLVQIA